MQLEILGSSMGTAAELAELLAMCADRGIRPVVDSVFPFAEARQAFTKLASGDLFGKIALSHEAGAKSS
jgi:D-arabinose 1-dehydrogenase-like Zn-dependent alcohol dehydrogenase